MEADWHEGPTARRAAYLASLRATDPGAARSLLETSWKSEKADSRAEFLALLENGLCAADLPFLETALGDRSDRVAEEAARLAALFVDSPQAQFLRERGGEILEAPFKGRRLEFSAAQDFLDAYAVAFRQAKPRDPAARRKAVIQRILCSAPLDIWTARLGMKPAELFSAIEPAELADIAGRWLDAACAQLRPDWLIAFLDALVAGAFSKAGWAVDELVVRALSGLKPGELRGRFAGLVEYWAREGVGPVAGLIRLPPLRPPWSEAASAEILTALRQWFVRAQAQAADRGRFEWKVPFATLLELSALAAPIDQAPSLVQQFRMEELPLEVAAKLAPQQRTIYDHWRRALAGVREIVEFRLLLHRELAAVSAAPSKESL
jgi:hypothetical protein